MTMNPNDPNYRREFEREADEEGMSTAAWAGIAVAVMLVGGVAMYAFSSHATRSRRPATSPASSAACRRPPPARVARNPGCPPRKKRRSNQPQWLVTSGTPARRGSSFLSITLSNRFPSG